MASTLLPFRQVHENDVVNLFAYDGSSATRGLIVKLKTTAGWDIDDNLGTTSINNSYANTVSDRYDVKARVETCASGNTPFGMLMYDVAETDENGEKLIYNPRKAAEMQCALSGQAVPIATKGIFVVNGVDGTPAAGGVAYCGAAAANDGLISATAPLSGGTKITIGKFLGAANTAGDVLLKLEL